ncbi:hypothetical protein J6590_052196 [Homalodisca vitripennis]|nr:hypothetical protein J6590_052196 [Homalodisca vitripennis]
MLLSSCEARNLFVDGVLSLDPDVRCQGVNPRGVVARYSDGCLFIVSPLALDEAGVVEVLPHTCCQPLDRTDWRENTTFREFGSIFFIRYQKSSEMGEVQTHTYCQPILDNLYLSSFDFLKLTQRRVTVWRQQVDGCCSLELESKEGNVLLISQLIAGKTCPVYQLTRRHVTVWRQDVEGCCSLELESKEGNVILISQLTAGKTSPVYQST